MFKKFVAELRDRSILRRRLIFFVPIAGAILIMMMLVASKPEPQQDAEAERAIHVRTVTAIDLPVRASAIAYGTVRAAKSWQGVAQVAGRVVEKHPKLDAGAVMEAGTVLLRIDPADYDVAANRAEADMKGAAARLAELDTTETNLRSSLALAQKDLELAKADVERRQALRDKGTISQAALDNAERTRLQAQQNVRNIQNQLKLIPTQRDTLQSQLTAAQAQIDQATLQQDRTTITLPFDGRIQRVNAEKDQYAAPGQVLVTADLLGTFEVTALIDPARFVTLNANNNLDLRALEARVGETGTEVCRMARVDRMSEARDARSRMIGVVIVVPATDPCASVPLGNNAYVKVKVWSPPRPAQTVIPRVAITQLSDHQEVLIVDEDQRIRRTPVTVDFSAENYAVVKSGINPGDTVIVSDLIPVVDGQLVAPHTDERLAERMREAAADGPPASSVVMIDEDETPADPVATEGGADPEVDEPDGAASDETDETASDAPLEEPAEAQAEEAPQTDSEPPKDEADESTAPAPAEDEAAGEEQVL